MNELKMKFINRNLCIFQKIFPKDYLDVQKIYMKHYIA